MSTANAQSACAQISKQLSDVESQKSKNKMISSFNPLTAITNLIGNKTDSTVVNNNVSFLDLSSQDIQNINNSCSNLASGTQTNVINQDSNCMSAAFSVCKKTDGTYDLNCVEKQRGTVTITKVDQTNKSKIEEQCFINNLINKISTKSASVDNVSAVLAAQKASGFGSQVDGVTSNCNEVRTDMSSKDFLDSLMKCANDVSNIQTNMYSACGGTDITQKNEAEFLSKCYLDNKLIQEKKTVLAVKSETTIQNVQTASTFGFLDNPIILAVLIICCLLISSAVAYTQLG